MGLESQNICVFFSGPYISNKNLVDAVKKSKLKFLGEHFKCSIPGGSTTIDDMYTPLDITTKAKDNKIKR